MEKSQIYVHVRSRAEGTELVSILLKHRQQIYEGTLLGLATGFDSVGTPQSGFPYIFFDSQGDWSGTSDSGDLDKVTISELDELLTSEK